MAEQSIQAHTMSTYMAISQDSLYLTVSINTIPSCLLCRSVRFLTFDQAYLCLFLFVYFTRLLNLRTHMSKFWRHTKPLALWVYIIAQGTSRGLKQQRWHWVTGSITRDLQMYTYTLCIRVSTYVSSIVLRVSYLLRHFHQ